MPPVPSSGNSRAGAVRVDDLGLLHRAAGCAAGVVRRVVHRLGAVERRAGGAGGEVVVDVRHVRRRRSTASRSWPACRSAIQRPCPAGPRAGFGVSGVRRVVAEVHHAGGLGRRRSGTGCAGPSRRSRAGSSACPAGTGCRSGWCSRRSGLTLIRSSLPRRSLVLAAVRWASKAGLRSPARRSARTRRRRTGWCRRRWTGTGCPARRSRSCRRRGSRCPGRCRPR